MTARILTLSLLVAIILILPSAQTTFAFQSRDHLTPNEVDLVKDTQILDKRIEVFIKAAERRVMVITGAANPASAKQVKKESETWGEMPKGTRAELMSDIAKIFDEAVNNIDDVNARDEKNPLIPKALRKLAASVPRIVDQLKPFAAQATGGLEGSSYDQLTENAEAIMQAASKLPPEVAKKGKSKGEKSN